MLAAEHLDWPKAEAVDAMQTRARHEIARLERGLVVLEIIVGIAPLLGLVGTILGMMTAFGNVGQAGQIDPAELAKGISLILRATLLGLLIAIPSLIFWSYYTKKVEIHRRGDGVAVRRVPPPAIPRRKSKVQSLKAKVAAVTQSRTPCDSTFANGGRPPRSSLSR